MKNNKWIKIAFQISPSYQDMLVGQFSNISFCGFEQTEKTLLCYIPAKKWNSANKNNFESILERSKQEFPVLNLSYKTKLIAEKNWNKTWERQINIVEATSQIIIKPSWKKLPKRYKNKLVLSVDPKMSFGTGHHETTRLSLKLIEKYIKPEAKVLDFGCGTGILGIACAKLGAKFVVAIDNDEWAIENANENIHKNNVKKKIKIILGSVSKLPRIRFDILVANVDFQTITKFIKTLTERIAKDGMIIFSGVLTKDTPSLNRLFKKYSLVVVEHILENEWSAIILRRM